MALASNCMKQIGARCMGCNITQMVWSNKMDLVAYGTDKGEVIVQRLNWQKIVTFPSLGEDIHVRSISWQIDETILSVAYSNGKVTLLDAEREEVISTLEYKGDIKRVFFSKAIKTDDYRNTYRNRSELTHDFFLPSLPNLNNIDMPKNSSDQHKSFAKGTPCFLVVLMADGKVHLLLLGALKAGTINISKHVKSPKNFSVHDVRLNGDCNAVYALVRDGSELKVLHFSNKILQEYISPMLHLAVHCANILETKNYINETVQNLHEAWETVLIEMDNKLTKYSNQQIEGTISADFMELLVLGYATLEIEHFLTQDLTEKGLKKISNSVRLSYSAVQSLVNKPLHSAAVNMCYFVNTIRGLSRITYYFKPLLSTQVCDLVLRLSGAFIMKIQEFQQVIDQCVNDMKLFFWWLGVVIVRLHQQELPEDMKQISPEDFFYLAEYLNKFEDVIKKNEDGTSVKRKFNMEKIGQYLEDKNLHQMTKPDIHHLWKKLLVENECLRKTQLLYPHERHTSLIQQLNKLIQGINLIFSKPNDSISSNFKLDSSVKCCTLPTQEAENYDYIRTSFHINEKSKNDFLLTTIGLQEVLLLEFAKDFKSFKCTRIQFSPSFSSFDCNAAYQNLRIVDLHFYNEGTISFLMQNNEEKPQSFFLQFPLDAVKDKFTQHNLPHDVDLKDISVAYSLFDIIDCAASIKNIDGVCTDLAVSGSRKVASILSDSKRKMTIFEMEVEEEEDETDISHNSLLELSKESIISNE